MNRIASGDFQPRREYAGARLKKDTWQRYGRQVEDLIREWAQDETVTSTVIAERLNCSRKHAHELMNRYGVGMTLQEARRRARNAGRLDYNQILARGRATLVQRQAFGSKAAHRVAWLLKAELALNPLPDWDIIVGCNEWHIVAPLEVDLPIVAIERKPAAVKRCLTLAVEIDGAGHAATPDRDGRKDRLLTGAGWLVIRVPLPSSPNEPGFREAARGLAVKVREHLQGAALG